MFLVIVALVILSRSQADKDMDKGAGTGLACLAACRSLHWSLPQEKAMLATGLWFDTEYSACVFAARGPISNRPL